MMISLFAVNSSYADMFEPSHGCYPPTKPFKPYSFNSQWEIDSYNDSIRRYNNEVEDYKNCISSFIDEQNDATRKHQNAANSALNDWNLFVSYN